MIQDAPVDDLAGNGNEPATKADLRATIDELAQTTNNALNHERAVIDHRLAGMEERLASVDERLTSVETSLASVEGSQRTLLDIVRSIDERLKGAGDIAARFRYLEDKLRAR